MTHEEIIINDSDEKPYNPLETSHIAAQLSLALMSRKVKPLPPPEFKGAGVYAIFYLGSDPLYGKLGQINREHNCVIPIYVGKAVRPGGRKGIVIDSPDASKALFNRLNDHAQSIAAASNLSIDDFKCKYLLIEDIWIPLAESIVITQFKPIWNTIIDGFGNHDPGAGRVKGKRSMWDTLHPGRAWANKLCDGVSTREELVHKIEDYLSSEVNWPPFDFDSLSF